MGAFFECNRITRIIEHVCSSWIFVNLMEKVNTDTMRWVSHQSWFGATDPTSACQHHQNFGRFCVCVFCECVRLCVCILCVRVCGVYVCGCSAGFAGGEARQMRHQSLAKSYVHLWKLKVSYMLCVGCGVQNYILYSLQSQYSHIMDHVWRCFEIVQLWMLVFQWRVSILVLVWWRLCESTIFKRAFLSLRNIC